VRAAPAGPDDGAEDAAVVAALLAEVVGVALGAGVDGVWPAWPGRSVSTGSLGAAGRRSLGRLGCSSPAGATPPNPCCVRTSTGFPGRIEWNVGSLQTGQRIVLQAARDVAGADSVRALEMAVLGTTLATFGAGTASSEDLDFYLPPPADRAPARLRCLAPCWKDTSTSGAARCARQPPALRQAFLIAETLPADADPLANLGTGAMHLGDHEITRRSYGGLLALARDAGAVTTVVLALARLPAGDVPAGQWSAADAAADEALVLVLTLT